MWAPSALASVCSLVVGSLFALPRATSFTPTQTLILALGVCAQVSGFTKDVAEMTNRHQSPLHALTTGKVSTAAADGKLLKARFHPFSREKQGKCSVDATHVDMEADSSVEDHSCVKCCCTAAKQFGYLRLMTDLWVGFVKHTLLTCMHCSSNDGNWAGNARAPLYVFPSGNTAPNTAGEGTSTATGCACAFDGGYFVAQVWVYCV